MKESPLHARIHAAIEGRIMSGEWAPGHRVPSESELMAHYGCARMTVNKALSALATAGLIERRRRAGSFVCRPRARSLVLDVPDLGAEIAARGQTYAFRLLDREVWHRAPPQAEGLAAPVLRLEGIHLADGHPLAHEERWISLATVPEIAGQDFTVSPPGSWLLHHTPWTEAEHRIGAAGASAGVAAALGMAEGTPCLTVERHTWRGAEGITRVCQHFLAGHYELIARFSPRQAGSTRPGEAG